MARLCAICHSAVPCRIVRVAGVLNDIGTEELAHLEMICAIVHQLTRNMTMDEIKAAGFEDYFVDHTAGVYPQAASGMPFSAATLAVTGDPVADISEDMGAEQKARLTYDNILRLADDPDVIDPIRFLREREIVHYQRFGESLRFIQDKLDSKNFYAFNPAFDLTERPPRPGRPAAVICLFRLIHHIGDVHQGSAYKQYGGKL